MIQKYIGGYANPLVISNIVVGAIAVILGGIMVWALAGYSDQKNNVDRKVAAAVSEARKQQSDDDSKKFAEQEKLPTREFVGPADLGRVSFQYPKTWSVYVAKDGSSGGYEAYLHPGSVAPVTPTTPYAARVVVEDKDYDTIVKAYQRKVDTGDLRSSAVSVSGFSGVRLDGTFSKERKGSAVVFKVRDKTLTIASDIESFASDYNDIVIKSLKFNP